MTAAVTNRDRTTYEGWSADDRRDEVALREVLRAGYHRKRGIVRGAVTKARNKWDVLFTRFDPASTGRSWTSQEYSIVTYQLKVLTDSTHGLRDLNDSIMELMPEGLYDDGAIEAEIDDINGYNETKFMLMSILEGYLLEQSKDNDAHRRRLAAPTPAATPTRATPGTPFGAHATGGLGTTAKIKYPALARPEFWSFGETS